jgi:hypothetical protein
VEGELEVTTVHDTSLGIAFVGKFGWKLGVWGVLPTNVRFLTFAISAFVWLPLEFMFS